jgi:hypothetical protein
MQVNSRPHIAPNQVNPCVNSYACACRDRASACTFVSNLNNITNSKDRVIDCDRRSASAVHNRALSNITDNNV